VQRGTSVCSAPDDPDPGILVSNFNLGQPIFGHHGRKLSDLVGIGRNSRHIAFSRKSIIASGTSAPSQRRKPQRVPIMESDTLHW
jgi:hypothetical protein